MPRTAIASEDGEPRVLPRIPDNELPGATADATNEAANAAAMILQVVGFRILSKITRDLSANIERALENEGTRVPIGFTRNRESEHEMNLLDSLRKGMASLTTFVADSRFANPGGFEARICAVSILDMVEGFYRQLKNAGGRDELVRSNGDTLDAAVHLRSAMLNASIRFEALERGYVPQDGLV